jgi:hypothetical protein
MVSAVGTRHWPLLVVLAPAALLRVGASIAYHPVLLWTDSWEYVTVALKRFPVGITPTRPSGYPLVLKGLSLDGRTLDLIAPVQHLAGLATGILLYALLVRLGARRWLAAVAAAFPLLDAHTIALEQYVMAEPLSTLALIASVFLLVASTPTPLKLGASGLLLAAAVSMRTGVAFAVPVWLIYAVWVHRPRRAALAWALAAALLPLIAYAGAHAAAGKGFGLTEADGWFLYGRTAPLADCSQMNVPKGTRPLCGAPRDKPPGYYTWDPASPANRLYGGIGSPGIHRSNDALRRFALAAIEARPSAYARAVLHDLGAYLTPTPHAEPTLDFPIQAVSRLTPFGMKARKRYFPGYRPRSDWPASALVSYADVVAVRGWMLVPFMVLALIGLGLAAASGRWRDLIRYREILLLLAIGLVMVVGSTATVGQIYRYVIPAVPFITGAGVLAAAGLVRRLR